MQHPHPGSRALLALVLLATGLAAPAAPAADALVYRLNDRGICYLAYNGTVLFERESNLFFGHHHATLVKPDGTLSVKAGNRLTRTGETFTNETEWGVIVTTFRQRDDTLFLDVAVTNASPTDTLQEVELSFTHLGWPIKDAQFGSFNPSAFWAVDRLSKFGSYERAGGGMRKLFVDYGQGCLLFGPEEMAPADAWPSTLGRDHFAYFGGQVWDVPPGATKRRTFAFQFAPAGTDQLDLAAAAGERYGAAKPMVLDWPDRRPIIQDTTLANGINFSLTNPRRYQTPQDLGTEEGKRRFRAELLRRADSLVEVMRRTNAQGIVMWSIEGIEQKNVMYLGDPTRTRLWPEMEWRDETGVATVDAYLKRITAAGFRIGHCLRPQRLEVRPVELGTVFHSTRAGTVTHVRLYTSGLQRDQPCTLRLWRQRDQALLGGPWAHTLAGAAGWVEIDIPDVRIEPGESCILAVALPAEGHCMSLWTPEASTIAIPADQPPAATGTVPALAIAPTAGDRFTSRVRGYLVPPADGAYTFWVTGDNLAALHLADTTPDHLPCVAYTDVWTGPTDFAKRPHQKSRPITLAKGQRYYFELRHAEGIGNEFATVFWAKPGDPTDKPAEPVPGTALLSLNGVAGEAEYTRWDDLATTGGALRRAVAAAFTEEPGACPRGIAPYGAGSPLHDIVFVADDGGRESLFPAEVEGAFAWKHIEHYDVADPARHMIDMIGYCKQRWGSTLFYVDSCVFINNPPVCPHQSAFPLQPHHQPCACSIVEPFTDTLHGDVWKKVHEAHPDVLVMPENQHGNCYPYTAPFDEGGHHGVRQTPRRLRAMWPGAFTVINVSTDQKHITPDVADTYVPAVRGGDILMFQQWEYLQQLVNQVYAKAGHLPAARIAAPAHGATVHAGQPLTIAATVRPGQPPTLAATATTDRDGTATATAATATDRDGTIATVEFFASTAEHGRTRLGQVTAPPWQWTWPDVPPGRHVLSLKATDHAGLSVWSAAVEVDAR